MTQKGALSEQGRDSVRRYRAYSIVRRLFAAMDDDDDRVAEGEPRVEGIEQVARDVVDAIPILFRGADGRSPSRIAIVFAEAMIARARPADDATFGNQEKVRRAAQLVREVVDSGELGWGPALCGALAELEGCSPHREGEAGAATTTRNRPASDRWGVWCTPSLVEAHTPCGGAIVRARWAAGPDGDLVLFETVAKHLAKHFNEVLPGWRHRARPYDAPPPLEDRQP